VIYSAKAEFYCLPSFIGAIAVTSETRALTYTSICHATVHVLELSYGALLVGIGQEFGASLFILGVLANIFGLAFGATALPSGFLADRIGEKRLLAICCSGTGIAAIAVGFSPNVYALGAALLLLGLTLGLYHPAGAAFIAKTSRRTGLAYGYLGIGGNLGIALGPIIAVSIAAFSNWRFAYIAMAVPAFLLAAAFYYGLGDVKEAVKNNNKGNIRTAGSRQATIVTLVIILTAQTLNGLIYRALVTYLPLYLGQGVETSSAYGGLMFLAGSVTTVALLFGVAGQFLGGYLSDRMSAVILAIVVAAGSFPLLLGMGASQGFLLVGLACVLAVFHFMGQPVFNVLVADNSPDSWRGRVFGFSFFCNFGLGSFSAGSLGFAAEKLGLNWVFIISAGFAILSLAAVLVLLARFRGKRKKAGSDSGY
jgi:MFS family permease